VNYFSRRLLATPQAEPPVPAPGPARRIAAPAAFFVAALVLSALLSVLGEKFLSRVTRDTEAQALARAEAAAGSVEQFLLRTLDGVTGLQELVRERQAAAGRDYRSVRAIEQRIAREVATNQFGVVQAAQIDAGGRLAWSTVPGFRRIWLGDREHFRVHRDGLRDLFVSEPVVGRATGRLTLQFSRALAEPGGDFAGVAVVSVDVATLMRALGELRFGEGDMVAVLRTDGTVLARSQGSPEALGRPAEGCTRVLAMIAAGEEGAVRSPCPGLASEALVGVDRVEGSPLVAVFALDADRELASVGRTAQLVRMTTITLTLLLFAAAALCVLVPERQRARAALAWEKHRRALAEASEREIGDVVGALPGAIYRGRVDAGNAVRPAFVDRSIERVTGWQWSEDQEFAPWHALVEGETRAALRAFFARVAKRGHESIEYRLRRPDGGWIWVRETARVVHRRAYEAEIVGYVDDITAEREIAAQAQAASKLATLGHMATSLAHELNQPIAVMSLAARNGIARLRAEGAAAVPGTIARLERIAAQADRAIEITEQLRIFGHAGSDRTESVALATAVRGALLLTGGALQAIGARVKVALTQDLPPVRARLVPLEQVIVNLLLNARDALEAREPGRRELVIETTHGERPDTVRLRVSDSGGGIPAEGMGRIFEAFFTTKPVGRGTGLGLSFCFGTMTSFGGAIAARNTTAGAEFLLTFQVAPQETPELRAVAEAAGLAAAEPPAPAA